MPKPLLLDLFCGPGGSAMGYHRAGFDVIGVDIKPQPNYPFRFVQADVMDFLPTLDYDLQDAIHASPPCQKFSLAASGGVRRRDDHPDLIWEIRRHLKDIGLPYVIENVPQAPLLNPITLCGTSFELPIIRHRSFECSFPVDAPWCGLKPTARVRHQGYLAYPYARKAWRPAWREHVLPFVWPWMELEESGQAIPPAYTEHIGLALMAHLSESVANGEAVA